MNTGNIKENTILNNFASITLDINELNSLIKPQMDKMD